MIQKQVQDRLATMLLEGSVSDGDTVQVSGTDLGLYIGTGATEEKPKKGRK